VPDSSAAEAADPESANRATYTVEGAV